MSSTDFSKDFISANYSKVQSFNFSTAQLAINKKQDWNEFQGIWLNIKIFNISQESFLLTQICQVNGGFTMTWYHTRELLLKPLPLHSTASMGDALIVRPCEAFPWSYGDASMAERDAGTCTQRLKNRDSGIWIFYLLPLYCTTPLFWLGRKHNIALFGTLLFSQRFLLVDEGWPRSTPQWHILDCLSVCKYNIYIYTYM